MGRGSLYGFLRDESRGQQSSQRFHFTRANDRQFQFTMISLHMLKTTYDFGTYSVCQRFLSLLAGKIYVESAVQTSCVTGMQVERLPRAP